MINWLLLVFLLMVPPPIDPGLSQSEFIVWNVGQGLWVTYIDSSTCHHFDIGGEKNKTKFLKKSLREHCLNKINFAYFSHWDWDHIGLAQIAKSWLPNLCIKVWPQGSSNFRKKNTLSTLGECHSGPLIPEIVELTFETQARYKPNQLSRIFLINNEILLPGDSPVDMEKKWREQISDRNQIRILVLGHHGSKTSTSPLTLNKLLHLKAGIASSNPRRYGHPHQLVLKRLRKSHVPVIKTVSWNSLHFLSAKRTRPRASLTTKH